MLLLCVGRLIHYTIHNRDGPDSNWIPSLIDIVPADLHYDQMGVSR